MSMRIPRTKSRANRWSNWPSSWRQRSEKPYGRESRCMSWRKTSSAVRCRSDTLPSNRFSRCKGMGISARAWSPRTAGGWNGARNRPNARCGRCLANIPFGPTSMLPRAHQAIELRPIDARLSLPSGRCSYFFEEFSRYFCVDQAFGKRRRDWRRCCGKRFLWTHWNASIGEWESRPGVP